jgi:hypothetical protein
MMDTPDPESAYIEPFLSLIMAPSEQFHGIPHGMLMIVDARFGQFRVFVRDELDPVNVNGSSSHRRVSRAIWNAIGSAFSPRTCAAIAYHANMPADLAAHLLQVHRYAVDEVYAMLAELEAMECATRGTRRSTVPPGGR